VTKKKRRKRPAPLRQQPVEASNGHERPPSQAEGRKGSRGAAAASRSTGRATRAARTRTRASQPWIHPPLFVTVARGLRVVGGSPLLVISSFLAVLALWSAFAAFGVVLAATPGFMGMLVSLPPMHTLFLDIQVLLAGGASSPIKGIALAVGLIVVRAALMGFWISLILQRLDRDGDRGDPAGPDQPGRGWTGEARAALRRMAGSFGPLVGVEAGFFALAIVTLFLAVGLLGQFAAIGGLLAGLYFFVFAPIAVITERTGLRGGYLLAVKAARLPGPKHLVATASYVALSLMVSVFAPPSPVAAATPSVATWLFVLFVSFLHMIALATFTYRWLVVREHALAADGQRNGARPQRAPAPLR
jgi:hypothetical protein